MRIIVCGSRDWEFPTIVWNALEALADTHPNEEITIIHGDARGADRIAGHVAEALGMEVIAVPAEWEKFGKTAGPMRNKEMLGMSPDSVLAFRSDGPSPGTDHMVKLAIRAQLPVRVIDKRGLYRDSQVTA